MKVPPFIHAFWRPPASTTVEALEDLVRIQDRRIKALEQERDQWKRDHDILMALL